MKLRFVWLGSLVVSLTLCLGSTTNGADVNVATWTQNEQTGGGLVTLNGSLDSNVIALTTPAVGPNTGLAGFEDWTATPATNGYVTSQSPGSGNTWIAIGVGPSTVETLTFASAIVNPILLFSFGDTTVTYDFGAASLSLLSAHNASLSGGVLSFLGSGDTDDDGAALRVNGTFTTINFLGNDVGRTDTQRFTVATPATMGVPEPASWLMLSTAVLVGAIASRSGRRARLGNNR
jgi:hypothetical protein